MKTLKKALSIILGLAIMLSCVAGMQVSVSAEGNALALSVGEATVADGVVTVPVVVDSNTGFQALTVEVDYDDTVLDLVSAEKATISDVDDVAVAGPTDANPFKIMWAFAVTTENVTATGTVATLTFDVVDETAESTNITLNVTEAWDVAGNEVAATATAGTVEFVKEPVGPVVDDTLVFASVSVGYGTSSLQMSFRVENTVLDKYADMEIVLSNQKYDLTTYNLIETPFETVVPKSDLVAAGTKRKQYVHTDIQLFEIGLDIDYMLRAYDAEGNLVAVSETFTISPATFLKNSAASSTNVKLKTVVADTLIVGDKAAEYFGTEGSDLANAKSLVEGYDISAATPNIESYNTINEFISNDTEYGTASTVAHQVRTSVQIGKVPFINFRIADQSKVLDLDKLVVTVSYTSVDSQGEHPYTFTFTGSDFNYAGKYINCTFDQVGLHDSNKNILFTVTYDGVEKCSLTYSIETYLGTNLSSASVGALADSLIKLGNSFRAYAIG